MRGRERHAGSAGIFFEVRATLRSGDRDDVVALREQPRKRHLGRGGGLHCGELSKDRVVLLLAGVGGQQWIGKVPQRVIALGYLRDDRLIAMANAAADCVVVPSSIENLPNGVIEAFACGRPVVAFDAGGIRDAVRTGENGILVPAGDANAFAKAIDRILGDDDLRGRCAQNALDTAQREYSAELEAVRFERLYDEILTRHDSPTSSDT